MTSKTMHRPRITCDCPTSPRRFCCSVTGVSMLRPITTFKGRSRSGHRCSFRRFLLCRQTPQATHHGFGTERTCLLYNNEATMLPGGARLNVEGVAIMGDSKIELAVVRSLLLGQIRLVTRNGCLIVRLAPTRLGAAHRPLMTTSLDSALVGWRCWLGPFCHGHLLLGPDSTTRL